MVEIEVARRFDEAKRARRAYLLVCYDVFDRLRGDEDMGYYYPAFDDAESVKNFLAELQFGVEIPGNVNDVCEAVIDLSAAPVFSPDLCVHPRVWLMRQDDGKA